MSVFDQVKFCRDIGWYHHFFHEKKPVVACDGESAAAESFIETELK